MLVLTILFVIAGYLVGSIPAAYIIARWRRGVDIRKHGSGNVGAANTMTVVGKRWSLIVSIFDIGKGVLMVWLSHLAGISIAGEVAVGVATVVGHDWPVFLRFQGGRGVFTTLGVITILSPWLGLISLVTPYLFFAPFKQLALGVFVVMVGVPTIGVVFSDTFGGTDPAVISASAIILMGIMGLRRLTVPRTAISKDVPLGELLLYRLLFDRDIRDRKTWINQKRG